VAKEDIKIERFVQGDEKEIVKLLSQAKLPAQDLTLEKLKHVLVAKAKDGSVIGAEWLTREVESIAQQRSIKTLFLLTTTAAEFFPKLGYQVIQRDRAPMSIAKTDEFKNICPVSAVCLFKTLEPT